MPLLLVRGWGLTCDPLDSIRWVSGHIQARDGHSWAGHAATSELPFSTLVTAHLKAAPPGPEARAGIEDTGRWAAGERSARSHVPLSGFFFSPLWGTVCGFRWSGLVPQLPPELHQWTDLPVFCHRTQGLWYGFWFSFVFLHICLFIDFLTPFSSSGPSPLYPSATQNCTHSMVGTDRTVST